MPGRALDGVFVTLQDTLSICGVRSSQKVRCGSRAVLKTLHEDPASIRAL